jgi:hypothetical protein
MAEEKWMGKGKWPKGRHWRIKSDLDNETSDNLAVLFVLVP